MSVTWTTNGDGAYEVSSAAHLLQIMQNGALGADTNPPTNYWAASYVQTSDIDLVNDHANIVPIGTSGSKFTGSYDGGLFQIQNWSYSGYESYAGLFGYADGATLRKLRLGDVWGNLGTNLLSGFICGRLDNSMVYDVEGNFADGSSFGDRSTNQFGGTLFGWVYFSDVQGATVRGSVHFATSSSSLKRGGIAGQVDEGSHTLWRNLATFPNGIAGGYAGGFIGEGIGFSLSNSQNFMIGDILGTHAGGIVGYVDRTVPAGSSVDTTVNSMTGNITSTTGGAGGIFGETTSLFSDNVFGSVTATKVFNYMSGDITGASGAGGIIGTINGSGTFVFSATKSIVAMQGTVDQSVRGSESVTPQTDVYVDTSFGLVATGNDYGSATIVVDAAFVYDPNFTDLPYFDMSGTDDDGTSYKRDFVFANIGGKSVDYTHLSVHTTQVSAPFYTDFGLAESNDVVYLTYANVDTNVVHHDSSLTIVETTADPNPETDGEVAGYTPIMWYKLDGPSLGDDSSGSSLNMTNTGVTSVSDSTLGNVAYLNGSAYLDLTSSLVPSAMLGASSRTISFWAKTGSATTRAVHGNGSNVAHNRFRGQLSSGTTYGIDLHTNTSHGSIAVPLGTWGHYVCTFESGTTVLSTYTNGVFDSSKVDDRLSTGNGAFNIGRDPTNTNYAYFNGYVSDFRVYDGVLDASAIQSLTNAGPLGTIPDPITWSQNGSGQYLVESKEHLLQIMSEGALFGDAGTSPTDYWGSSYLQTSDIDLISDHAIIVPIGNNTTKFTGEYDGGLLSIMNWAYTGSETFTGLFGYCDGAALKRVRLSGVWTTTGGSYAGFLGGFLNATTVNDVEGDFSSGTVVGDGSNITAGAPLCGGCNGGSFDGLSVLGTVDFNAPLSDTMGGVIGSVATSATVTRCRNLATFPSGISGYYSGGIIGQASSATVSKCLNGMQGNLAGTLTSFGELTQPRCGGVIGDVFGDCQFDQLVNSMTGNISSVYGSGGVLGYVYSNDSTTMAFSSLLNYMTGDVSGSTNNTGGIVAHVRRHSASQDAAVSGNVAFTNSIVAMSGVVEQSVRGSEEYVPAQVVGSEVHTATQFDVTVDTSFGMTYTSNDDGSATMVVDAELVYTTGFTDLPYFVLGGTDSDGNVYTWDFVYANIGGKYGDYTHLSVHTAQVSAPYFTDFGLAESNTVVYLTYANVDTNSVHHDPSLTIVETAAATVIQLPGPVTSSYDKSTFLAPDGNSYDITGADSAGVLAVANDIFVTGDVLVVDVQNSEMRTTFVNIDGDINVVGVNALLLPFDTAISGLQEATVTLSDSTTVQIIFDSATGNISVGGTTYSSGDYFILDGQKVTFYDV